MILVTGGTGLVGAHLLYKLANSEKQVRAIYRSKNTIERTKNIFSYYTKDYETLFKRIEWAQADLIDVPALSDVFIGITHVYHCAALVSFQPNMNQRLRKTNIEGTANIVNLCITNTVQKLCYVSSIATLGSTLGNTPVNETTDWNPENDNSLYAITKYGAEMEVWRGTQEGLNAVIVNPGIILGPGIWNNGTGKLFKKAAKGFTYYTSGTIALIGVIDVVAIMVNLMESEIKNERFILVAEHWTCKKFLQSLAKSVHSKPPKKEVNSSFLNIAWRLDWAKHKLTGKPRLLTKQIAKSLNTTTQYNSDKLKTALNYKFKAVNETILAIGNHYQKQV